MKKEKALEAKMVELEKCSTRWFHLVKSKMPKLLLTMEQVIMFYMFGVLGAIVASTGATRAKTTAKLVAPTMDVIKDSSP